MATEKVRVQVEVAGAKEAVRAFNKYGKDANKELRDAAARSVSEITPALIAAMASDSPQSRLVASTIRPIRDRVPVLAAAGSKRVAPASSGRGRKKPAAGDIFFGAEFGGQGRPTTQQFRPSRGTAGYAFYPAFRTRTAVVIDNYGEALDRLESKWAHGNG